MNKLFKNFPAGYSLLDKAKAIIWRIKGCDHNTNACLDLGDEDHQYWYCYRCATKA